jgi:hypothetical protein
MKYYIAIAHGGGKSAFDTFIVKARDRDAAAILSAGYRDELASSFIYSYYELPLDKVIQNEIN